MALTLEQVVGDILYRGVWADREVVEVVGVLGVGVELLCLVR